MKVTPEFFDSNRGFRKVYQLQPDLEVANGHEILKLKNSMQAIHAKVDETYALLTKERESAHKAINETSTIVRETAPNHVEDTEKFDKLCAEVKELKAAREMGDLQGANDKLQAQVEDLTWRLQFENRMKKKIDKLSTQVEELKSWLESEKNPKQSESSEVKHQKLEETVNIPNQIQKSMNRLEEKLTNIESDNKVLHQQASTMAAQLESIMAFNADVAKRPQKSTNKKQQEYEDLLIQCISQHLGFSKGRPVAACIIYKCLRQWRSFEEERTTIFDRIILTIGQAIETQGNNNCVLAYWLSNASTLLLLRHTLEQVETKCPASIFEKLLTFYVEKIYGMIRDNLKREITPLLSVLAVKEPRNCAPELLSRTADFQNIFIAHWQGIVSKFDCFLNMLKFNNVPSFLVRQIFIQIFSFINVQFFNSFLLKRECFTFSDGEYVKAGLSELEHWCHKAIGEYAGSACDEFKHIRQALSCLVKHEEPKKISDGISLWPAFSIRDLYRMVTMNWDKRGEKYDTQRAFSDVIFNMRVSMTKDSNNVDDDPSIPFRIEDLLKSMDEMNIADVEPPPLIRGCSGFSFLLLRDES